MRAIFDLGNLFLIRTMFLATGSDAIEIIEIMKIMKTNRDEEN